MRAISFCLGSNANDAFRKYLSDWVFTLTIELDGKVSVITRSAGKPSEITIDGEDVTLNKLKERLFKATFEPVPGITKGIGFRSLLAPFIRASRGGYQRFDHATADDNRSEYNVLLRNCFLLGLDLPLVQKKYELRKRQTTLKTTMKQLESDPLFRDLLEDETAGIELTQLREDEARYEADLKAFKVAEDYTAIEREANAIKCRLDVVRRELIKVEEAIAQIDRSLKTKGDLNPNDVERIYAEARVAFPALVQKQIDEVLEFQRALTQNRIFRLTTDRQQLADERRLLEADAKALSAEQDEKLAYLAAHVALDEYTTVNHKLNEIRQRIAKLEASNEQRTKVSRELKKIDRDLADEAIKADDYLDHAKESIGEANALFRNFTKALYGNRASGITITNDNGENQNRFRVDAHITADAAEGINEAKIFCYDQMLLSLQRRHRVHFLVHDSTLFSPVDSRQRLSMVQLAQAITEQHDVQYIAMLNEHDILSMRPSDEERQHEFDALFTGKRVVLTLTDQSAKDKLLGIDVDMDYMAKAKPSIVEEHGELAVGT